MSKKRAIIIGGGPAGLTAAHELVHKTDIQPILLEASEYLGGIAKTVYYKGNRIDIGGHRFFSKSDRVMKFWLDILPLQKLEGIEHPFSVDAAADAPDPEAVDKVLLLRRRKSRIFFEGKFFDYPISLTPETVFKLGLLRTMHIALSYIRRSVFPIKPEENLEQFYINRFGRKLYSMFFESYTEKVWGAPCSQISSEWGAQRVKGLSISKAVRHFFRSIFRRKSDILQKEIEASLIGQFLYPKLGPGQLWEEVGRIVEERGGRVLMRHKVVGLQPGPKGIESVLVRRPDGSEQRLDGDFVLSSMPVRDLILGLETEVPEDVRRVAEGLVYRDFITTGLLVDRLRIRDRKARRDAEPDLIQDNWIYIQDKSVKLGRLQIFNNWSPYLVAEPGKVWLGLEYFCNEGDALYSMTDEEFSEFSTGELAAIGIIDSADVRDSIVIRTLKAYPAYFGSYDMFDVIRRFVDGFENLFLIGRNGMHRYNNQDHSMLAAMHAVENIAAGKSDKEHIWGVNIEQEYHEEAAGGDNA